MDKCREEFEAYFKEHHVDKFCCVEAALEMRGGDYIDFHAADLWGVYQHQQTKVEELQKRVDKALLEIKGAARWIDEDAIGDPDFIKGGVLAAFARLEQALKGGESKCHQ